MIAEKVSLAVVIPTRNRASLAIDACESLLRQTACSSHVFVSDNSTDPAERHRLAEYCGRADRQRITYLRPPEPQVLPTHWDWALRTAMERSRATHFTLHYDRRITKPGALAALCEVIAAFPGDVVTWTLDLIVTSAGRYTVWQTPWDGRVYRIETSRVIEMTATGELTRMAQAFPILSNCAIPRDVLAAIAERFGSVCDSTGPDSCFMFRFCAIYDHYIHFDRTIGIVYATHRSTEVGYLRGKGGDFDDFAKSWGDRAWLSAAPIPGLTLGLNMLFHEYELIRRATGLPGFKPIERNGYCRALASALTAIDDPARVGELRQVLVAYGCKQSDVGEAEEKWARRLLRRGAKWIRRGDSRVLLRTLHTLMGHISGFSFADEQTALRQSMAWSRKPLPANPARRLRTGVDITPVLPSGAAV